MGRTFANCGQLVLILAFTYEISFSCSLAEKTYEIRRLNESTFLVTSLTQRNRDRAASAAAAAAATADLDAEPKRSEVGDNLDATLAKPAKAKNVPSSLIQRARENYFRTFYSTSYKPTKTKAASYEDPATLGDGSLGRFNSHLLLARRLAATLVGEAQYDSKMMAKERFLAPKVDKMRRRKRARRTLH